MRRRLLPLALVLALVLGGTILAAEDILISLSYLNGTFRQQAEEAVDQRLDKSDETLLDQAVDKAQAAAEAIVGANFAGELTEASLKEGDILSGTTGLICVPLSGQVRVTFPSGGVVDVTAGTEVASGTTLTAGHRYLVAEDTLAQFTVASQVAVVAYEGRYGLALSGSTDYVAMADALKQLNLFQGTGTGYGKGYDLEKPPTRLQALVMFLRVMGEEQAALAYTGSHPFTDVRWGDSYVAYAVDKGYTDGVSPDRFGADNPASAVMFTEFLLRAMGYSKVGVDNWETALERAEMLGCITKGEYDLLKNGTFTRAQVVYLSYYSLETTLPSGQTLADRLVADGVFTRSQLSAAQKLVTGERIE